GRVLRRRTQPRASAFGVSRTDARRDVLRHRGRGAGGPDVTRGRRTPSARGGQPIGVLRDVPITRSRMTTLTADGLPPPGRAGEPVRLKATAGSTRTARSCE